MSLIKCPECGKDLSTYAIACPHCGCPVEKSVGKERLQTIKNINEHMVQCKNCGTWNFVGVHECKECHKAITGYDYIHTNQQISDISPVTNKKEPFYSKTWFVVLMFCCWCFPVGLFLMWKYKKFNKNARIVISVIFAVTFLFALIASPETQESESTYESNVVQETVSVEETTEEIVEETKSKEALFIDTLLANKDVTENAAIETYRILTDELGFTSLTISSNISGTLFDVNADDYKLRITVSDKLYMVICGDYNLYEDDTVKYTKQDLENRSIDGNETYYYTIAQEIIRNSLKSPKSADFPSIVFHPEEIKMQRNGDLVAVQSYVDAQNSFGAIIRSKYVVEFMVIDLKSFVYETVYINLDGEEAGEFIKLD